MDPEKPSPIEEHKFLNMAVDHESLLSEFPQQVVDSHALVVAEILAGERPSIEILLQLGAEALTVDKLAVLTARQVGTIQAACDCWRDASAYFQASVDLWHRLPFDNDLLAGHRRLLERLVRSAQERREFYTVTDHDRAVFNAQRDHGMPLPIA